MGKRVDAELCRAIGTVLAESGGRALTVRQLAIYVAPFVRVAASVADCQGAVAHLERRGDLRRLADPDDPELLSYLLTPAGVGRFGV
ncbi:MAG: hypothetical protein M0Q49_01950 [Porticoccaceae bacterium]|nr:hypothetical protein [Porticoccaceae bacterium]